MDQGRSDYYRLGRELGLPTLPSFTNFVSFDLGTAVAARSLLNGLLERGVFVRSPTAPPLDRLVRVTVASPVERATFAQTMHELAAMQKA